MNNPTQRASLQYSLFSLLVIGLVVVFGLQMLRALMTGLVFYFREVQDAPTLAVGAVALATFATGLLAPIVTKSLGRQRGLTFSVGGLAIIRLLEQFVDDPGSDLGLSIAGTAFFLWSLVLTFQQVEQIPGRGFWALAVLAGVSAETAIKGVFGTLDLSWERGITADTLLVMLVVILGTLVQRVAKRRNTQPPTLSQGTAVPLIALGGLLVVEILLLQNIGQQTVYTGWPQPAVFTMILFSNLAGVIIAMAILSLKRPLPWYVYSLLGGILVVLVALEPSDAGAAIVMVAAQVLVSVLFAVAVSSTRANRARRWAVPNSGINGGMLAFLVLIFIYYATYDIDLGIPREAILPIAAGLVALGAVVAARGALAVQNKINYPLIVAPLVLFLFLPLVLFIQWEELDVAQGGGYPVRVMSYNLHQGFGVSGKLELKEMVEVIKEQRPDVLALQEVSRAWVVNGAIDMLVWLSQELSMDYVWGPATDSVWGNAVLSRYPIVRAQVHDMPNNDDLRLNRGFISVEVDIGDEKALRVVATHLHAGEEDTIHRIPQVKVLLEFWNGADRTILMGDLNGRPRDADMARLAESPLKDAFLDSGVSGPGFTSRSDDPFQRIDYIWISPDLKTTGFGVVESLASDHFAITATLALNTN